ncbi:hypothetical protein ACH4S8_08140 [Streptomyces sp. NPDC021080]|uniref:hypothetical protein n=1 Tax=Streptomyces sp. NPDC021080 TaxID=3365110 RepID=UPI00379A358A
MGELSPPVFHPLCDRQEAVQRLGQLYVEKFTLLDEPSQALNVRSLDAQAASQPDVVLTTLQRWKQSGRPTDEHFASIARGTLRNRLKED